MNVKNLHFASKPSYKLIRNGVKSLDTPELLAILFGNGVKNESSLEISHRLLQRYGLEKLGLLSYRELAKELDYVKALRLLSCIELGKRYARSTNKGFAEKITCAEDVFHRFHDRLKDEKKEYCFALYLDSKNQILKEEVISVGTLNASLIHPREVFKIAIQESANSIILVHNHPSGDPKPSQEDILLTRNLIENGKTMGINLLDHVIIGKSDYYNYKSDEELDI